MLFLRRLSLRHIALQKAILLAILLNLIGSGLVVAQSGKRPLSAQDFDSWRSVQGSQISRDGKWVAYVMQPQDGDGEVLVRSTTGSTDWKHPRGYRPPTPPPDASDPSAAQAFAALGRRLRPIFSADSKYALFNIEPTKAEILKARKDKKKPEDMPKTALGIMDLATGKVARVEAVKSFQVPEDGSGFVAILKEAGKEDAKPPAASPNTNGATPTPTPQAAGKKKTYGTTLILRDLADGKERTFADVLDYSFSKDAKSLVFAVSSKKEETDGAFVVTPQSSAAPTALLSGAGKYTKFTWDEDQKQLAFISDKDDAAAKQPKFKVYHWNRTGQSATEVVSVKTAGFRPEYVVSEKGSLSFSFDGSRLFISSAPQPDPEPDPKDAVPDEERVLVDLWHWKDDYVQPQQKVRMIADRDRSYRAVWHIADKKFVQLADTMMESVNPRSDGLYAIGTDDRSYRIQNNYDPGLSDQYLVNTSDGSRKLLRKGERFGMSWSPGGKYIVYFDGKDWNSISIPDGRITNLTAKLKTKFVREDHDSPSAAPAYGVAGWTKDDKEVLINDRFDIWQVAPDGSGGKMLTAGLGRSGKTQMRYIRLDPDERFVEPNQTMLLRAESEETRDSGFYRVKLAGTPEKLVMDAKSFGSPTKAKDADMLMFSASRFDMFPDVWVSAGDFREPRKLSDGDAQRQTFNWGHSELIRYKSSDGVPLQGVLIKPDNFDPKKKYPMMVYLYEKLSDTVHDFRNPGPGTSVNLSYYASNDYVIFLPDIVYKIGYPGKSAMNCIMPGVESIVKMGFVDEKAIGIQGHSWGGYQIAYMITQTNKFKAAAPGALVADMFSAYNGIRWGTGLPRQFQYERTQSRIGGTPWTATKLFTENSPLFYLEKVQTPVLMIHNDNDDAVPWYQGIEFYLSLRRLNKEVYFFSYNGEFHGLRKRQNQKDYSRRMKEYFDHFLKGSPEPDWMKSGIPYLQREKEKEQYRPGFTDDEPRMR
ncbi:MAG: prolyl oligopeptidase family serine peptidase [Pyrinomonadaceae bacterium]